MRRTDSQCRFRGTVVVAGRREEEGKRQQKVAIRRLATEDFVIPTVQQYNNMQGYYLV